MTIEFSKEKWMAHAISELDLAMESEELREFYLKVLDVFTDFPHNENTLYFTPEAIEKLMRFENLRQLTEHDSEWVEISEGLWRNKRNPRAYSNDKGETVVMFPRYQENYANNTVKPTNLPPQIAEAFSKLDEFKPF
jgi:hypothetical protein